MRLLGLCCVVFFFSVALSQSCCTVTGINVRITDSCTCAGNYTAAVSGNLQYQDCNITAQTIDLQGGSIDIISTSMIFDKEILIIATSAAVQINASIIQHSNLLSSVISLKGTQNGVKVFDSHLEARTLNIKGTSSLFHGIHMENTNITSEIIDMIGYSTDRDGIRILYPYYNTSQSATHLYHGTADNIYGNGLHFSLNDPDWIFYNANFTGIINQGGGSSVLGIHFNDGSPRFSGSTVMSALFLVSNRTGSAILFSSKPYFLGPGTLAVTTATTRTGVTFFGGLFMDSFSCYLDLVAGCFGVFTSHDTVQIVNSTIAGHIQMGPDYQKLVCGSSIPSAIFLESNNTLENTTVNLNITASSSLTSPYRGINFEQGFLFTHGGSSVIINAILSTNNTMSMAGINMEPAFTAAQNQDAVELNVDVIAAPSNFTFYNIYRIRGNHLSNFHMRGSFDFGFLNTHSISDISLGNLVNCTLEAHVLNIDVFDEPISALRLATSGSPVLIQNSVIRGHISGNSTFDCIGVDIDDAFIIFANSSVYGEVDAAESGFGAVGIRINNLNSNASKFYGVAAGGSRQRGLIINGTSIIGDGDTILDGSALYSEGNTLVGVVSESNYTLESNASLQLTAYASSISRTYSLTLTGSIIRRDTNTTDTNLFIDANGGFGSVGTVTIDVENLFINSSSFDFLSSLVRISQIRVSGEAFSMDDDSRVIFSGISGCHAEFNASRLSFPGHHIFLMPSGCEVRFVGDMISVGVLETESLDPGLVVFDVNNLVGNTLLLNHVGVTQILSGLLLPSKIVILDTLKGCGEISSSNFTSLGHIVPECSGVATTEFCLSCSFIELHTFDGSLNYNTPFRIESLSLLVTGEMLGGTTTLPNVLIDCATVDFLGFNSTMRVASGHINAFKITTNFSMTLHSENLVLSCPDVQVGIITFIGNITFVNSNLLYNVNRSNFEVYFFKTGTFTMNNSTFLGGRAVLDTGAFITGRATFVSLNSVGTNPSPVIAPSPIGEQPFVISNLLLSEKLDLYLDVRKPDLYSFISIESFTVEQRVLHGATNQIAVSASDTVAAPGHIFYVLASDDIPSNITFYDYSTGEILHGNQQLKSSPANLVTSFNLTLDNRDYLSLRVNHIPVGNEDFMTINCNSTLVCLGCVDVLANDMDGDIDDTLVISDLQVPSGFEFFTTDGILCYNGPVQQFSQFTYIASDGVGGFSNETLVNVEFLFPLPSGFSSPSASQSALSFPSVALSSSPIVSPSASQSALSFSSVTPNSSPSASESALSIPSVTLSSSPNSMVLLPPIPPSKSPTPILVSRNAPISPQISKSTEDTPTGCENCGHGVVSADTETTGGLLFIEDASQVIGVLEFDSSLQGTITVVYTTSFDRVENVGRTVFDITLRDDFGFEITRLPSDLRICITKDNEDDSDYECLGYFNTATSKWECEDRCLESRQKKFLCGDTDHLTSFALLLSGTGEGGGNNCSSYYNAVISWLSLAFIIVAIIIVLISLVCIETRVRYQSYRANRELETMINNASRIK